MKAAADRDAHACSDGLSRPFDAMGTMVLFSASSGSLLYHEPTEEAIRGLKEGRLFDDLPFEAGDAGLLEGQKAMRDWLASAAGASARFRKRDASTCDCLWGVGETLASPWASVYLDRDGPPFGDETLRVRAELRRHGQELKEKHHERDDRLEQSSWNWWASLLRAGRGGRGAALCARANGDLGACVECRRAGELSVRVLSRSRHARRCGRSPAGRTRIDVSRHGWQRRGAPRGAPLSVTKGFSLPVRPGDRSGTGSIGHTGRPSPEGFP